MHRLLSDWTAAPEAAVLVTTELDGGTSSCGYAKTIHGRILCSQQASEVLPGIVLLYDRVLRHRWQPITALCC